MDGTHQIAVRTPKGFGQYVVTLVTTAEGGSGDVVFGQASGRTHLTTALSPETTLKVPLLDPFGNPLAGGKVEWESGDDCGDGSFCGSGQTTTWRTSLAGVALNPVTPQTGGTPLWQARSAQQELGKALQPIDRPGVMERVLAARHVEPVLGFVSSHGRAVGSSQLPDLATAAAITAETRLRAQARPMAGVKGGPLCGSHPLTCSGEAEPVFRAVRLDVQPDEELVSVNVEILEAGIPIDELDGPEVLSTVGLTLEATATVRNGSGVEREISLNDPINVSVYGDQGGGISQLGRSCDQMEVAAGAFDYLVGINSAHQFQYEDEFGEPCCWMPTEVVHASIVAEMEVDDGQGGASRVFREAETVVKSIPRPADPCEVQTLETGIPGFAAYPFVEVGTAYLTDACGNIVYGVGLADSEDHNQPGDEFRVVAPVGPVWATARSDGNHWSYSVLLNGDVGDPDTIPDGAYTVDFEVASQSPECSAGGVITGSYTVSIADDAPQVVLWWDWEWDAQNSPRGPEPDDQLISPGSAVRDASGAVAMWRVPAFDGAADSHFFAGSYSNVPVKLYVAWYGSITFDPDGSPEPSYLEPVEGVELCTGVVEKLTDAAGHLGYNSPVRTTCDTPWATFATAGASSDPVDTPQNPAGPPDTWVPVGLGVGVTKGPEQPGRYVLVAEPIDPAFRRGDAWRVMSPFLPDGFVGFEVGGGMFLDEDYIPLERVDLISDAQFHLSIINPCEGETAILADVRAADAMGNVVGSQEVTAQLLGTTAAGRCRFIGDFTINEISGEALTKSGGLEVEAPLLGRLIAVVTREIAGIQLIAFRTQIFRAPGLFRPDGSYLEGYISRGDGDLEDGARTYQNWVYVPDDPGSLRWKPERQWVDFEVRTLPVDVDPPPGVRIRWDYSDPDDPSDSGVHDASAAMLDPEDFGIDPDQFETYPAILPWEIVPRQGDFGNDNRGGRRLSDQTFVEPWEPPRRPDDSIDDSIEFDSGIGPEGGAFAVTSIESRSSRVRFNASNASGDNFRVSSRLVWADELEAPSYSFSTGTFTLWKRMAIEYRSMAGQSLPIDVIANAVGPAFIELAASPQMPAPDKQDFGPNPDLLVVTYCDAKPPGEFENRGSLEEGAGWHFLCAARNYAPAGTPPDPPEVPPPGYGRIVTEAVLEIDDSNPPLTPGCCGGFALQVRRPTGEWWTFDISGTEATTVTVLPMIWSRYNWRTAMFGDSDPRFGLINLHSPALGLDPGAVEYRFVVLSGPGVIGITPTDGCALVFVEAIEGELGQGTPESIAEIEITSLHEFVHAFSLNGTATPVFERQFTRHLNHKCGWPSLSGQHSCAMNYSHDIFTFDRGFSWLEQQPELCASHIIALRLSDGLGGLNYVP